MFSLTGAHKVNPKKPAEDPFFNMYFSMISVRLRTSSVVFPNAPNNILLSLLIKDF